MKISRAISKHITADLSNKMSRILLKAWGQCSIILKTRRGWQQDGNSSLMLWEEVTEIGVFLPMSLIIQKTPNITHTAASHNVVLLHHLPFWRSVHPGWPHDVDLCCHPWVGLEFYTLLLFRHTDVSMSHMCVQGTVWLWDRAEGPSSPCGTGAEFSTVGAW
jgi:hypothetical protein